MRNLNKKYETPEIKITEFECEDIITASPTGLRRNITGNENNPFVKAGSMDWKSGLNQ